MESTKIISYWVTFGALSGALLSGANKIVEIVKEPSPKYVYPMVERPIRGVYHTSRIAGHAGWGAVIAGFVAATFPVSIPMYIFVRSKYDQTEVQNGETETELKPEPKVIDKEIIGKITPPLKIESE